MTLPRMWRLHPRFCVLLWAVAALAGVSVAVKGSWPAWAVLAGAAALALGLQQLAWWKLALPLRLLARDLSRLQPGGEERLSIAAEYARSDVGTIARTLNLLLDTHQTAQLHNEELHAAMATMEAQYRQLMDFTSAGIFVLDAEYRLIHSNPTVSRVMGATPQDMATLRGVDFIPMVFLEPDAVKAKISEAEGTGETCAGDFELHGLDGKTGWVHCLLSVQLPADGNGRPLIEGVIYDVTQRKRDEEQAAYLADHDPLTGLKNRASFERSLEAFIAAGAADERPCTVMFIDLDGFKKVNDTQGHAAGDRVLVECAKRISGIVRRNSDVAARLGGDELVLLLANTDAMDAHVPVLAGRVLERIGLPIVTGAEVQAVVGASIGVASYPRHGRTRAEVLHAADEAMYAVKRKGKNAFGFAPDEPMRAPAKALSEEELAALDAAHLEQGG